MDYWGFAEGGDAAREMAPGWMASEGRGAALAAPDRGNASDGGEGWFVPDVEGQLFDAARAGAWSGGASGECGCGEPCSCGGACGCKGEGGDSCGGGKPSGEVPLLRDYDGETWASSTRRVDVIRESVDCWAYKAFLVQDPGWYALIPKCPCTVEDLGWMPNRRYTIQQESTSVHKVMHPGSDKCFRVKYTGNYSGNQCCYDEEGNLITNGAGTGTPDIICPIQPGWDVEDWPGFAHEVACHFIFDVAPFYCMKLERYLELHPPYHEDCLPNPPVPGGNRPPDPQPPAVDPIRSFCEDGCWNETFGLASAGNWTEAEADRYFEDCVTQCVEFWS